MAPSPSSPFSRAQPIDDQQHPAEPTALAGVAKIIALDLGRGREQLADMHVPRVFGERLLRAQDEERYHDGAGPVRHLVEVKEEPLRQQHDLDGNVRHPAPGNLSEQREGDAREHVRARGPAPLEDRRPRPRHVRRLHVVARQFQRIVGLDGATHVEFAAVVQRPPARWLLMGTQVGCDLGLKLGVDLVQEVHHHDVFGGNGAVRLEFEQPIARGVLCGDHRIARLRDRTVQEARDGLGERERDHIGACGRLGLGAQRFLRDTNHDPEPP